MSVTLFRGLAVGLDPSEVLGGFLRAVFGGEELIAVAVGGGSRSTLARGRRHEPRDECSA